MYVFVFLPILSNLLIVLATDDYEDLEFGGMMICR
jgi:hypothetical protein